ncbi:MAG TPA: glucose 1-dehydrogenase [Ktedonobacteraceae bacterium]|jgi:threonine dehydrogenase-like Zn-dependent dehydrogenase|nr:glucose 1-dehydrogenase [Ktedonobacteraceae bacterium]
MAKGALAGCSEQQKEQPATVTMKAVAVFPRQREIALIEHPEPLIERADQVKIRILEVGMCGTDKEICTFAFGSPPPGSDYLILGHESLGEVVEVGNAVSHVHVGDLVVVTVRRPCHQTTCQPCQAGRQDYCETGDYTERGIQASHGFLTEYVVEEENYVNVVPWSLREIAVLVEPLTIAEKAFARVRQMQQHFPWRAQQAATARFGEGQRAVVLGAGPVGLLGMMLLVTAGFETFVYSRAQAPNPKSALVEAVGATYISSTDVSVEQLARRIDKIDIVYEALGVSQLAFAVMRQLGPHGIFVFTGVPGPEDPQEIALDRLMHGLVMWNQAIFGTVNASSEAFSEAIRDLAIFKQRWPTALSSMITGRYPLEQFQRVLFGQVEGIKNVLLLSSEVD